MDTIVTATVPAKPTSSTSRDLLHLLSIFVPAHITGGLAPITTDPIQTARTSSLPSVPVSTMTETTLTTPPTSTDLFMSSNITNHTIRTNEFPALGNFQGDYDVDYIARINTFWLQFDPPSPLANYIIAAIYIIISIIGCSGNALVIFMFIRCKSLRTHANTLVINLAVSDFFMLAKCPIAIYNSIKLGPALGDIGCRLYGFIGGLTGTASILTLTAIALDRYNVVVYPLDPRSTNKFRSRIILFFIWIYSFCFAVIPSLDIGLSVYVPEGFLTTCSFDYMSKSVPARIFMLVFFVGAWCIPFGTISYCYFYIHRVVSRAKRIQSNKDHSKIELKLAAIVIGVIGLWFFAWTPYSIVALMGISGNENKLTPLGSMIPSIFCKTSACIDPYIYAVIHPRFRMEFKKMFFGERYIRGTSIYRSYFPTRCSSSRRHRVVSDMELNRINSLKRISENSAEAVVENSSIADIETTFGQTNF